MRDYMCGTIKGFICTRITDLKSDFILIQRPSTMAHRPKSQLSFDFLILKVRVGENVTNTVATVPF